jgi:hypothetical protein
MGFFFGCFFPSPSCSNNQEQPKVREAASHVEQRSENRASPPRPPTVCLRPFLFPG